MKRRDFLRLAGAACLPVFTPRLLVWAAPLTGEERDLRWNHVLVLVDLQGGNDGLNTVIPFADENYYRLRPHIGIPKDQVLRLGDTLGLHPDLKPLLDGWEHEDLAVVLGVGYEHPNRSHFRSIEIWETGSDSNEYLHNGWVARLFARSPAPRDLAADGIIVGRGGAGPLEGTHMRNVTLIDPARFTREADRLKKITAQGRNPALEHILEVREDLRKAAHVIEEHAGKAPNLGVTFPKTSIGRQLETAARLLASRVPIAVIKASHGGFDTHSNQDGRHRRLLAELAEATAAFRKALVTAGLWDRTLMMTYSEFGRRAAENGSGGTDHGTAAPHFVTGGAVRGGFYGKQPALEDLKSGDLRFHVDYRTLYSMVARSWWRLPKKVLADLESFRPLPCLRKFV